MWHLLLCILALIWAEAQILIGAPERFLDLIVWISLSLSFGFACVYVSYVLKSKPKKIAAIDGSGAAGDSSSSIMVPHPKENGVFRGHIVSLLLAGNLILLLQLAIQGHPFGVSIDSFVSSLPPAAWIALGLCFLASVFATRIALRSVSTR